MFCREVVSEQENRSLARFPEIHSWKKDLPKFSSAFEPFFKDHLPLRLNLIQARNFATFKIFNTSANPLVVVGKQNWLFYKSYGVTPAQLNLEPFKPEELREWANNIAERNSFLKTHHIKFLLVLAPEKGSMYPELLPEGWHRSPGSTRLEQLQDFLKQNTNVDLVDARQLLSNEKSRGYKIYHSNDSHWNQRSAFLVSQEILSHLHRVFESIEPVPSSELLDGQDKFSGDLAKMLALQQELPDFSPSIVVRRKPQAVPANAALVLASMGSQERAFATQVDNISLPRALVLRDSFCTYLTAPLSEHFRFTEFQWTNEFHPHEILAEKPDIVIDEIAERHLYEEFHEHVPSTAVWRPLLVPNCSFDNKIKLIGMSASRDNKGTILKLCWRCVQSLKLDYTVGVHCLDSNRKVVGGADYQPDILQRELRSGTEWTDTVAIPNRELKEATQVGILTYHPGKETMHCDAPNCDWNTRYIVPIENLYEKK